MHHGRAWPESGCPGRVIAAKVLPVSRKLPSNIARRVCLDICRFLGLAETEGEAIHYRIETSAIGNATGHRILACGAYCTSHGSIGFNGFPPLDAVRI